jgi:D-alanine-D-alanine ligase
MNIVLLAYLEPDAKEPDIVVGQVEGALRNRGHQTSTLAIHDDVAELVAELRRRKPDAVFNLVESFGADILGGLIGVTGVLDLLEIPYTGGGPGELYLQEDKALSKKLLAYDQILYPDFASFSPDADFETGGKLRLPLFVKPARMDASIGIDEKSLVRTTQQLLERVANIHEKFGDAALAEEYIEGRELYVGVLGNQEPLVFPPVEMDFSGLPDGAVPILDNQAKFDAASERYQGTKAVLPELEPELKARVQKVALDAYRALRVRDYGRIDLRLTESGDIYVIEVNANCYLEKAGEFAMAAQAADLDYDSLISRILELALERWEQRSSNKDKRQAEQEAVAAATDA